MISNITHINPIPNITHLNPIPVHSPGSSIHCRTWGLPFRNLALTSVVVSVPSSSSRNNPTCINWQSASRHRGVSSHEIFLCMTYEPHISVLVISNCMTVHMPIYRTVDDFLVAKNVRNLIAPVISPISPDAWKIDGFSNTNKAEPDAPVRDLLNLTSGIVGSSIPLMNCRDAASHEMSGLRLPVVRRGDSVVFEVKGALTFTPRRIIEACILVLLDWLSVEKKNRRQRQRAVVSCTGTSLYV